MLTVMMITLRTQPEQEAVERLKPVMQWRDEGGLGEGRRRGHKAGICADKARASPPYAL